MPKVTVYEFKKFDIVEGMEICSGRLCTPEAIKSFDCVLIPDTGKEIDSSLLDGDGCVLKTRVS